ncbi:MAG: 30S ribosomal protein S20 [Deltaproteobacteria bacterium RIFOXYA12_FULL_61_11]|nr:MAG: 30S ribosomal protein S20 [Deltaproteobacteria bacterium RIFOXYA12_FULL_61_11]
MANHASALKRYRQSVKRRLHNRYFKTSMKTSIKKFLAALEGGDKTVAGETLKNARVFLDKLAGKGLVHRNLAARRISRLTRKYNAL